MVVTEYNGQNLGALTIAKDSSAVLFFYTDWHKPCVQLLRVIDQLAKDCPAVKFFKIEGQKNSELSKEYNVQTIPTTLIFEGGKLTKELVASPTASLVAAVKAAAANAGSKPPTLEHDFAKIGKLLASHPVMIAMEGSPDNAGQATELVKRLRDLKVRFGYFDVTTDEHVRKGIGMEAGSENFPHVFCKGKLVDNETLADEGKLRALLPDTAFTSPPPKVKLETRLKALVSKKPVMLFMKGNPDEPQCGFSRRIVELLRGAGCKRLGHFNILEDNDVRQGLKEFSNWPTYPQLYVDGKLVGGLDVVTEMIEDEELDLPEWATKEAEKPPEETEEQLNKRIAGLINREEIMLFMKGDRENPKCKFSRQMVGILKEQNVSAYGTFDILQDEAVRQGIKVYSSWKTFPQLYHKGSLVGGLDIVKELIDDDEFQEMFS